MDVHNALPSVNYHERRSSRNTYYDASSIDENEAVILHPLIIGKDLVVCMPEVNRVLRNVYQVLSQANYYLSKHGIASRRYTGAQLIRIKMLGILGHEAKVCSYILQKDAERVFDNFDMTGDSRKSTRIKWMEPVLLDEKPIADVPRKRTPSPISSPPIQDGPVKVHQFELDDQTIICAPEVQKVVQANFHQGATVGYYFTKLGVVPFKFVHTYHLDKIKELGIIKRSAVHCTYITKKDALRVFDAYGLGGEHLNSKVNFLEVIILSHPTDSSASPWKSAHTRVKNEGSPSMAITPKDDCVSPTGMSDYSSRSSVMMSEEDDDERKRLVETEDMTVHVFVVEQEEVVCMPDIHKIVQNIHGNSIQVNYYFNKLKVAKKRFCFAHLRELKSRNVLQSNATYCTYVPRSDAAKIFQIYCLVDDPKLKQIQWTEPINLDSKPKSDSVNNEESGDACSEKSTGEEVSVHTFLLDKTVVLTVPDVHRVVDYLDEQSASLDYHFRKLGITKCRFTYSQLHQLRRLNVIKRPTVCTYITRSDVDRLLSMYETERNKAKIASVLFLPPVTLVPGTAAPFKSKHDKLAEDGALPSKQNNSIHQQFRVPSSPSDELSPSFIQTPRHSEDDVPLSRLRQESDHHSAAISHLQNIHPQIDCPIVIPNGDYDPMKLSGESQRNSKRRHSEENSIYAKNSKYDNDVTQLMNDINRKEDELRLLNGAYRHEITQERDRRLEAERKLEDVLQKHQQEMKEVKEQLKTNEYKIKKLRDELDTERELRENFEKSTRE